MDEKRFEALWERAEAEGYATRLAEEYPGWRARRRRAGGIVAGVALVLAVATPLVYTPMPEMKVYCNNAAYDKSHWTDMASNLLMEG